MSVDVSTTTTTSSARADNDSPLDVCVWVGHWGWRRGVRGLDLYSPLPAISRCTTQLIRVKPPDPDDTDTHSSDSSHLTHTHTPHSTDDKDETTEDI